MALAAVLLIFPSPATEIPLYDRAASRDKTAPVNDVFIAVALIFNNHRAVIFIEAEGINSPTMGFTRVVFGLEKADAKERFHMGFDQHLQIFSMAAALPGSSCTFPPPRRKSWISLMDPS